MSFSNIITEHKIIIEDELLEGVEESPFTMLYCNYTTSPKFISGWWVNIWKTSYLVNRGLSETLELLNAINIPYAPGRHYFKKFGDTLKFVLIFPQVPKHWYVFDFIEKCKGEDGLTINGIKKNSSGIYRVTIS